MISPGVIASQTCVEVALVGVAGAPATLTYAVPEQLEGMVRRGASVVVPLGPRAVTGIVLGPSSQPPLVKLRPISEVLAEALIPAELIDLSLWAARYYQALLPSLLRAVLPPSIRKPRRRVTRPTATAFLARPDAASGLPDLGRAKRQAEVLAFVVERQPHPVTRAELAARFVDGVKIAAKLVLRGLLQEASVAPLIAVPQEAPSAPFDVRRLTPEQSTALAEIGATLGRFATFLLFGVTGSGKTEVYLRCAAAARAGGSGVLILVPEIALTHQLVSEVTRRFPEPIAVLHSGLSEVERREAWHEVASGRSRIVIGARSAIFAPLPGLGLIVVDEEHDAAYKQEESPRYNARDLAVMRGKLASCPVVLASATPSLESYHAATTGKYRLLSLTERANAAPMPAVKLIDLRELRSAKGCEVGAAGEAAGASKSSTGWDTHGGVPRSGAVGGETRGELPGDRSGERSPLSRELAQALVETYRAGEQSLLFLNRRGHSRFVQCLRCGHVENCPDCSVSLTVHRARRAAVCHHCGFARTPASRCPSCDALLVARSFGTEQLETAVRTLLPAARVARLDRDTSHAPGHLRRTVNAWREGELDVLVGTQMIAKGHDVPGVTLIGVVFADGSLNFPDFRAAEHTFQLLAQVAGRAGRGTRPGRVLIQTYQPEHASLVAAGRHDFLAFAASEMSSRGELGYPPFARLTRILLEGAAGAIAARADQLGARLRSIAKGLGVAGKPVASVLGPAPAPLERLRGRYRVQLLVKARDSKVMARLLAGALEAESNRGAARSRRARDDAVRVIVDVDPQSML